MSSSKLLRYLAIGAAPVVAIAVAVPVSLPSEASPAHTAGARQAAVAMPRATGPMSKMIVMLKDRPAGLGARSEARLRSVRSEEAPVVTLLTQHGARIDAANRTLPFLVVSMTSAQERALRTDPVVQAIEPDATIRLTAPAGAADALAAAPGRAAPRTTARSLPHVPSSICGTPGSPETDPEAVNVINAPAAATLGYDGAGVTVAYIAGGIDSTIADFQRNAAYASAGSAAGTPVVTPVNFTGDPASTPNGDAAGESFLDASSIAAQANTTYNLRDFVNASDPLPNPCDITVVGAAPGANVLGLDVFSSNYDTTESNFIQAIAYAVSHGAKVLNESFGANNFPDTALDATRLADDDAVAAGVTVVVSSGDAGVTSTLGSPATDPNLISVGASTTFRAYQQANYGGINATTPAAANGAWINNNISSLSSGGFAMGGGGTVDLVAPGDLNWALCSTNATLFPTCTNEQSTPTASPLELSGGTSESAPLTAGAAADVIQAYAATHAGTDPSPALVKQILMSTATDIQAPGEQQGAGLLNVLAAVKEAASITGTSGTPQGGVLVSPNQINVSQNPGTSSPHTIHVTNTSNGSETVDLSTRALTGAVAGSESGSFCLNPSNSATGACGPPTANTFSIWSGVTEVYQEESFTVPSTSGPSRLNFSADYPYTGQSSLLHIGLIDPTGAYAGYSLPQGLADYANVQVANPVAGNWTAVFFTEQNGATTGGIGTSGMIQWRAVTSDFVPGGTILPSSLTIAAGQTATATYTAASPTQSGDAAESIVLATEGGVTNTIPVTIRTLVPVTAKGGGTFSGILTGGNGRGNPAQTSTYVFNVPKGERDIDVSAKFADANDAVNADLVDPEGQMVASSSSLTTNSTGSIVSTNGVNLYKDAPQAGRWMLVLDWLQPVSGSELSEPFSGAVRFDQVSVSSNLPAPGAGLVRGTTYHYHVTVKNTGLTPEEYFVDPRASGTATVRLADLTGSDQNMSLPLAPGFTFPIYVVPTDTTKLITTLTGSVPVTYDIEQFLGDPDLSPALAAAGVTESQSGDTANLTFTPGGQVAQGIWLLNPSEIGPYGTSGAPGATASATFKAVTQAFDRTVTSSTGDLFPVTSLSPKGFTPVAIMPGKSATITVSIKPTAAVGSQVSGFVNVDDSFLADVLIGVPNSSADELASIPYSYKVVKAS